MTVQSSKLVLIMTGTHSDTLTIAAQAVRASLMRAGFNVTSAGMSGTVGLRYTAKLVVTNSDTTSFLIDA